MAKKSGKAGKGSSKGSAKAAGRKKSTGSAPADDVIVPRPPAAARPVASATFTEALRVGEGFSLFDLDARSTPGFDGDKAAARELLPAIADATSELQERLWAESKMGGTRSLLLVVQGMDTSGKGGIMRHVVGEMDPQGVDITAFKAPSAEERRHPFLWRIRRALPRPGTVGVFDRSHYEDVLIARVRELVPRATWSRRYAQINAFERSVVASGTTVVKVMLHISGDEQKSRLMERLDRPDKNWKFNPGDVDERMLWPDYQEAYQAALTRCSTPHAPWYAVPADRKWYARLAVASLVLEHLRAMDPQWPQADYDVATERARLAAT
jgi:PPK2 family polyphosphate:nucleotide phosphotransferase